MTGEGPVQDGHQKPIDMCRPQGQHRGSVTHRGVEVVVEERGSG